MQHIFSIKISHLICAPNEHLFHPQKWFCSRHGKSGITTAIEPVLVKGAVWLVICGWSIQDTHIHMIKIHIVHISKYIYLQPKQQNWALYTLQIVSFYMSQSICAADWNRGIVKPSWLEK